MKSLPPGIRVVEVAIALNGSSSRVNLGYAFVRNTVVGARSQPADRFEVFILFNKTLMCGGLVIAAPGTSLQVLLAVLIMLLHLLVVLKLSPYENDHEDWTSFVSALTLLLTTLGAWALRTNDPDVPVFHNDVLAGLMIAISGFCLASQLFIVVFLDCGLWEQGCSLQTVEILLPVRV